MNPKFSDPAWWPKKQPEPLKAVSLPALVIGTLLPLAAIAGVVVFVVTRHHTHRSSVVVTRSIASFTACLKTHGVIAGAEQDGQKLRAAAALCNAYLPVGTQLRAFEAQPTGSSSRNGAAFESCMQAALANVPRPASAAGVAAFRKAIDNASATCRAITRTAGGGNAPPAQTTTTTTTTSSTPPIA
jgi:hypothetical protein